MILLFLGISIAPVLIKMKHSLSFLGCDSLVYKTEAVVWYWSYHICHEMSSFSLTSIKRWLLQSLCYKIISRMFAAILCIPYRIFLTTRAVHIFLGHIGLRHKSSAYRMQVHLYRRCAISSTCLCVIKI